MSDEIRLMILLTFSAASLIGIRVTFARSLRENDKAQYELGSGRIFDSFTTNIGGWLFPFVVVIAILDGFLFESLSLPNPIQDVSLIFFVAFGLLLLWTDLILARHFRSLDIKNPQLISTGPFAVIRHPRYASWLGLLLSFSVANNSAVALVGTAAFTVVVLRRIRLEESFLLDMYGDKYVDYAHSTRRLVPMIW